MMHTLYNCTVKEASDHRILLEGHLDSENGPLWRTTAVNKIGKDRFMSTSGKVYSVINYADDNESDDNRSDFSHEVDDGPLESIRGRREKEEKDIILSPIRSSYASQSRNATPNKDHNLLSFDAKEALLLKDFYLQKIREGEEARARLMMLSPSIKGLDKTLTPKEERLVHLDKSSDTKVLISQKMEKHDYMLPNYFNASPRVPVDPKYLQNLSFSAKKKKVMSRTREAESSISGDESISNQIGSHSKAERLHSERRSQSVSKGAGEVKMSAHGLSGELLTPSMMPRLDRQMSVRKSSYEESVRGSSMKPVLDNCQSVDDSLHNLAKVKSAKSRCRSVEKGRENLESALHSDMPVDFLLNVNCSNSVKHSTTGYPMTSQTKMDQTYSSMGTVLDDSDADPEYDFHNELALQRGKPRRGASQAKVSPAHRSQAPKNFAIETTTNDNESWTRAEERRFAVALTDISAKQFDEEEDFWKAVSAAVKTKSWEECQKHFEDRQNVTKTMKRSKRTPKKNALPDSASDESTESPASEGHFENRSNSRNSAPGSVSISRTSKNSAKTTSIAKDEAVLDIKLAGKGTLKRKEQIREMVKRINDGHSPGLFDANTPLSSVNKRYKVNPIEMTPLMHEVQKRKTPERKPDPSSSDKRERKSAQRLLKLTNMDRVWKLRSKRNAGKENRPNQISSQLPQYIKEYERHEIDTSDSEPSNTANKYYYDESEEEDFSRFVKF